MANTITTAELDAIARLGLEDLRACFSSNPPDGALDRAELTLKLIRQGTSRYSAENNRVAIGLKVAKALGLPADEQKPLWKQIVASQERIESTQIEDRSKQTENLRKSQKPSAR